MLINKTITKQCINCGCDFDTEEVVFLDRKITFQKQCDTCVTIITEKLEREEERQKTEQREKEFWSIVPKIYQTTDASQISPKLKTAIDEWKYGPIGLGFKGPSGSQKTRASVLLLHSLHKGGRSVFYLKATNLTKNAVEAFSDDKAVKKHALESMRNATECQVLLLDDIGKGRLSPSAEESLYALLDTRTENMLPTIWTTNADSSQLHDMMSEDRADAIMRRLIEFSKIITTQ
jgi:DNA replication protein DnaC